jgi:hypothetical protein
VPSVPDTADTAQIEPSARLPAHFTLHCEGCESDVVALISGRKPHVILIFTWVDQQVRSVQFLPYVPLPEA